jgi:signal peptidase I
MADDRIRPSRDKITNRPKMVGPGGKVLAETEAKKKPAHEDGHKDNFREIVETIVFVVVLVLLLKTFVAEAFVIPTGSMATTLLGYHKNLTCPQCNYPFTVNGKEEIKDADNPVPHPVVECICPNCRFHFDPK